MNKKIFIIAEIGVNHNGDMNIAKKMIDVCKDCGVDAVKFQSFKTENIVTEDAPKAEYQISNTGNSDSQFDMLKKLELSYYDHLELIKYCQQKDIEFLSTPFDIESLELLIQIGLRTIKIPSGEITNFPFLKRLASYNKNIIMSTGMSTLQEIEDCLDVLIHNGTFKENVTVLHCNTQYPTPLHDVNMLAMRLISDKLNVRVGYSDHTEGIEAAVVAASLGAEIIEKHFTLNKNMKGPDHIASIEPAELNSMVRWIRKVEQCLGKAEKKPTKSEFNNILIVRKSIIASKMIRKGERFSEENITTKRPGNGISPMKWNDIIGSVADRDYEKDDLIVI